MPAANHRLVGANYRLAAAYHRLAAANDKPMGAPPALAHRSTTIILQSSHQSRTPAATPASAAFVGLRFGGNEGRKGP
ncbi:MAG: hypothetical protein HXK19_02275 [Alloprevotella tannerae]|uniref:hypothetical protein n=1 Tax=Alloprevotella tannerae TaxID=76122 RepID=UPI001CAAA16F|nr:hypothetical protein [Alloprevotella tannerae]MBF0956701.1 hypothetical protein [Alloprevotella tannerae]